MSSRGEPPVDATGVTLVSKSDPGPVAAVGSAGGDRTLAAEGTTSATREGDLAELEPGTVIARYRIVARLGAGGMGVVYRAHDAQLDREVALKLLRVGEDGTEGRTRMLREAKAAAKIRHPNVVTVYDAGEVFGRVFIAMELIDGVTLKAHFRGRKRGWREVLEIMLGAGEGLAAAHAVGLVHRDFKPDNVLVEAGGRVAVLDFGLARPAADVEAATLRAPGPYPADAPPVQRTLTQTGMLVGTPAYMAPEQHLARGVDARTDQFAYCVTFYECLFGERPFAGDTQAELTLNVVEGRLLSPKDRGDAPPEVFAALQRGLAVAPADRYPTLAGLLAQLRAIARKHERRDRRPLLVAAGLLVPLVAAAAYGLSDGTGDRGPVPPAVIAAPVVEREDTPGPRGLTGPGGAISLAPARPGVEIGPLRPDSALEVARLIDGILPEGTDADVGPDGLRLVGRDAAAWRDAATGLLAELDDDRGRRPPDPLLAQVRTPAGPCGVYLLAAEDFAARTEAIAALDGVGPVSASEPLRVVLALGKRDAQDAVARLLREVQAPRPPRAWCFTNTNLQDEETCHPTRDACEEDARGWLGPKARCHGKK